MRTFNLNIDGELKQKKGYIITDITYNHFLGVVHSIEIADTVFSTYVEAVIAMKALAYRAAQPYKLSNIIASKDVNIDMNENSEIAITIAGHIAKRLCITEINI